MQLPDEAARMTALLECRAKFEITSDINRIETENYGSVC